MGKPQIIQLLKALATQAMMARIVKHRLTVMAVIFAVTILFAALLPRLTISTSVYDLIIEDLPENAAYQEYKALFGNEEIIRIVIKSDNIFDPAVFQKIDDLAASAADIIGVRRVISLPNTKRLVDPSGSWPLERFEQLFAGLDLIQRNLISEDRKTSPITLVLANDADPDRVIRGVEELILGNDSHLKLYQIGMPLLSRELGRFTARDFKRLPPITLLVITLILMALFKQAPYVILPLGCVGLALIWTFGVIALTGLPLSILTMIVPVFLIAVGTAYCLHIICLHRDTISNSQTALDAVMSTYQTTSFPTLLAVGTTVLSLGTLFLSRIAAINEFALFACVGMLSLLIVMHTFLPAALSFIRPATPVRGARSGAISVQPLIDGLIYLHLRHQKKALAVIAMVAVICTLGVFQLRVETNPVNFFKADAQVRKNFHDIYQHLSGSFPVHLTMQGPVEGYFEDLENLRAMARIQEYLDGLAGIDKTISFVDYLKLTNYASNHYDPDFYRLPEENWELRMLVNNCRSMLGGDMLSAFMNPTFAQANILLLTHISNSQAFLNLRRQVLEHTRRHFSWDIHWQLTGFGIVISASSHRLSVGQLKSLSLTMISIAAIMFVLFLSFKVGLIAVLPNLFPIVVNFGIMGWLGLELSMATSLIASVAIGLAVDDTIHYLVRFNREFKKDLDEQRALRDTLTHLGRPIIYTTATIGLGFSVLQISGFQPTALFGAMMMITMIAALVGDLILLPALMQRIELVTLWDLVRLKLGQDPGMEIRLFKGLSRTEMHSVMMAGTLIDVPAGEILFRKGDTSQTMYAVISGALDVLDYQTADEAAVSHGVHKRVSRCRKGDIIGEMGLVRAMPRSATVVARENSELLLINWKVIRRLQWLYPPTAVKFFKNLSEVLCDRVERLTQCLVDESCIDDLTGMSNRKGLSRILEIENRHATRYKESFSLCLLELSFGGPSPDPQDGSQRKIIRHLARRWSKAIRDCDALSRITAHRFILLVSKIPATRLNIIVDRLSAVADQTRAQFETVFFSLKVSHLDLPLDTMTDGRPSLARLLNRLGISDGGDESEKDRHPDRR